ncbi:MAG: pirin family protein, partial [Alphaproteobacteria bacterium]
MPDSTRSMASAKIGEFVAPAQLGPDRMPVRHPFSPDRSRPFDPFLYLAHFGPRALHETNWGFGPHPHRGFETITYMLSGGIEHRDSTGEHAVLGPGDVQWMTAGGGIVHSEEPPEALRRDGGVVHGFQIWLNLPTPLKMIEAGFSVLRAADMPRAAPARGVFVRVIGGNCGDATS